MTTRWTWQGSSEIDDDSSSFARLVPDGTIIIASESGASGTWEWDIRGLDYNGTILWNYLRTFASEDVEDFVWHLDEAVLGQDGSVVLAGGKLNITNNGRFIKLSANGDYEWSSEGCDLTPGGLVMLEDGAVVAGGRGPTIGSNGGDFVACKLDSSGDMVSTWEEGTDKYDTFEIAVLADNESIVMAGHTFGNWSGVNKGGSDFAAVKLDTSLNAYQWRWQDGTSADDVLLGGTMGDNGSVILVGSSYGGWDGSNKGGKDFVAVKLDTNKNVIWKWQGGTEGDDCLTGAAASIGDGTVFLGGYTTGLWGDLHAGGYDFAGVQLNLSDGSELWRWQNGTSEDDLLLDVSGGTDGLVILAGETEGSWGQENYGGNDSFALILDTNYQVFEPEGSPAPVTSESVTLIGYTSFAPQPEVLSSSTNYPLSIPSIPDTITPSTVDTNPAPTAISSTTPTNAPLPAPSYSDTINSPLSVRSYSDTFSPSMKDGPPAPMMNTSPTPTNVPLPVLPVSNTVSPSTNLIDSEENSMDVSSNSVSTLIAIASAIATLALVALLVICVLARRRRKVRMMGPVGKHSSSLRISSSEDPNADGGCEDGFLPFCWHSVTNRATSMPPKSVASLTEIKWGVSSYSEEGGVLSTNQRQTNELTTSQATDDITLSVNDEFSKLDFCNRARLATPSRNFLGNVQSSSSKMLVSTRSGRIVPPALLDGAGTIEAMHDAAQNVMESCSVPIVRKIANLTSILAHLSAKKTGNAMDRQREMTKCWKILEMLRWAAELVEKGPNRSIESEPLPLNRFHDAVHHLVELIKEHQSKNKLTKFMMSSVYQRLQEEAEEAVDGALLRLHSSAKVESEQEDSLEEARQLRRKHQLDQIEIPADLIEITDQQLGRGGFGAVYIASYKGQKVAAKVISIEQTLGDECNLEENGSNTDQARTIRTEFLLELDAMMRLRSPYTVEVFGAITTRKHTLVLVMELLPGGDLRSLLRNAKEKLPEAKVRQITMDVCMGMVFLHSKDTIHGDIKSPNVLFDGAGRAKIADFGTSRWIRHANSTGLATYKTKAFTHMSIAWAAPEVLDAEVPCFSSDVYSFGVVMWEILSREKPWSNETRPREIMARVFRGDRLPLSDTFPGDLAGIMKACWEDEPGNRPTAEDILKRLKSRE